jgi:O-antigen chain-terminating methyltransferase
VDSFYRAFEDRYRGSRELIKNRLGQYLPFIRPLVASHSGGKAFDIGCGRGEWLELMGEVGLDAAGGDLDAEMLEACRERGLSVFQGDAIEHLATLDANSHVLISAFHVVEHVSFDQLLKIVREALRVLKPGGLLILETPNPENIVVATNNFYLDPSHRNPVPPPLLSFVAEHAGFDRVKLVRLQEPAELNNAAARVRFLDVFCGASPDYAIVAQKDSASTAGSFDEVFNREYGLTTDALANRYEAQMASTVAGVEARVQRAEQTVLQTGDQWSRLGDWLQSVTQHLQSAEERYERFEKRYLRLEERYHRFEERYHRFEERYERFEERHERFDELFRVADSQKREMQARLQQAESAAQIASAQLDAVYKSTSWRITAPMRWVRIAVRGKGLARTKPALKLLIVRSSQYARKRPWLRAIARAVINRMPRVKARLVPIVIAPLASHPAASSVALQLSEHLNEHASRIYAELERAFERSQREKH